MISFIIIGHNEEKNIRRCIKSVYDTISINKLTSYEIIFVDSKSKDKTIQIAKEFKEVRIFKILGTCNAAIGRNIGAAESKGETLFFIDGDMEINAQFLMAILNGKKNVNQKFVSGQVIDVINGKGNEQRNICAFLPGGIFLIDRMIWMSVGGMKTKFKTGEDLDLGLRLHKKGCQLLRKSEIITKHHTIPIYDRSRIWKMLYDKSFFYSRCVLYRNNLFNKKMYYLLIISDKTLILFLSMVIASVILPREIILFSSLYFFAVICRSMKQPKYVSVAEFICFFIIMDFLNAIYFFTFFPRDEETAYKEVKD